MGISVTNITRPGAVLQVGNNTQIGSAPGATNPLALHIEEYGGEVEGTIARMSIMHSFIPVRSIQGTSTISNFRVGESALSKVTPGTAPDGTVVQASKVRLTVDTLINARAMVPLLDDFQNSYDARAAIGQEHGKKFSKFIDQAFMIQAIKAAEISDMTDYPAGWQGARFRTSTLRTRRMIRPRWKTSAATCSRRWKKRTSTRLRKMWFSSCAPSSTTRC